MSVHSENINCLICNSNESDTLYDNVPDRFSLQNHYTIVRCRNCQFAYLSPRPSEKDITTFYDLEEYQPHNLSETSFFDRLYKVVRDMNSKKKRRLIESYKKGEELLDIGCGTGEFLIEMKRHDWRTRGMETAPVARKLATEKDLNIEDTLEKIEGRFDVITMWHVLEHVHRVNDLLDNIKRLLSSGGYLILAVPNIESLDAKYFKNTWVALDEPRHLYHFRPQDIYRLLKTQGLEIIKISSILYFDPLYNALLSAQLKANLKGKRSIRYALDAAVAGKLSFMWGMLNSQKCSSPVYIVKRTS
jgi:2-polyprenyl-3-methyl-5-hydroxy-6-metoxy-1,4-benzoquinol methylase